jgi:hypothetical protein
MYRCMSMEAEGANASVAQAHMQTFYNALRAKISTDTKIAEIER